MRRATVGNPGGSRLARRAARLVIAGLAWPTLTSAALASAPEAPPGPKHGDYARAFDRGDYVAAIALAKERLRTRPRDVEAQIVLARGEAALGKLEAAFAGFREALRLDPRSPDALYYLAITAGVLAQREHERLLSLAPGSSRAHQLLGEAYEAQSRLAEAEAEYKAALAGNPGSLELLVALGDLTRRNASYDEAIGYFERAAALSPRSFDVLYGLGVSYGRKQDHARAIEYLRQALRLEPASASARLALGNSLLQTGQAEAAVLELQAAIAAEPRMREAYYLLGRALNALGRTREGAAAFAKVQELIQQGLDAGGAVLREGPAPGTSEPR